MKMKNRLKVATAVIAVATLFGPVLLSEGPRLDFSDAPILLPPFWSVGIRAGATGTVVFRLRFKEGRVRRIEVVRKELKWNDKVTQRGSADRLTEDLVGFLTETIKNWTSVVVSEHETTLTVVLQHDSTLTDRSRTYQLKYGADGIVRELVMSAPVFQPTEPER